MSRNNRSFRQLDCLDALLAQTLREIRFIASLVEAFPAQPIQIECDDLAAILAHVVQKLDGARKIVQEEVDAIR